MNFMLWALSFYTQWRVFCSKLEQLALDLTNLLKIQAKVSRPLCLKTEQRILLYSRAKLVPVSPLFLCYVVKVGPNTCGCSGK